jgi:hypothetical protein
MQLVAAPIMPFEVPTDQLARSTTPAANWKGFSAAWPQAPETLIFGMLIKPQKQFLNDLLSLKTMLSHN